MPLSQRGRDPKRAAGAIDADDGSNDSDGGAITTLAVAHRSRGRKMQKSPPRKRSRMPVNRSISKELSDVMSSRDDESDDDEESEGEEETVCQECGDELEEGCEKYLGMDVHARCGKARRALDRMILNAPSQVEQVRTLRKKDRPNYNLLIKGRDD